MGACEGMYKTPPSFIHFVNRGLLETYLIVAVDHTADGCLEVRIPAAFTILDIRREKPRDLGHSGTQDVKDFAGLKADSNTSKVSNIEKCFLPFHVLSQPLFCSYFVRTVPFDRRWDLQSALKDEKILAAKFQSRQAQRTHHGR